jgi:hypothetical protein
VHQYILAYMISHFLPLFFQAPWRLLRQPKAVARVNDPGETLAARPGNKKTSGDAPAARDDDAMEIPAPMHRSASEEQSSPPVKPPAAKCPRKGSKGM